MKIGEAVAMTGMAARNGYEPVVVVKTKDNRYRNRLLSQCANQEIRGELFLTSALFAASDIDEWSGRSKANVKQVGWLPMDFDLSEFTGIEKERIHAWPEPHIRDAIQALVEEVKLIYNSIGLPYHRIDYTGYGIIVYTYLPEHGVDVVDDYMAVHGPLVDRINRVAGENIADPQVRDAGSRFTRLPPSPNRKGNIERIAETLEFTPFSEWPVSLDELREIGGPVTVERSVTPVASHEIQAVDVDAIVELVEPHWSEGKRHMLALGLCGMLAKSGIPEDQSRSIVDKLSVDDPESSDRFKCVDTSYRRMRNGGDLRGFFGVKDALPADALQQLDTLLQRIREASLPVLHIGEVISRREIHVGEEVFQCEFIPIPDACLTGWIGQYVQNMLPTTEAPAAFHWASAMGWVAASMGRHICIQYQKKLFANLFILLVGPSGRSRKDTAIGNIRDVLMTDMTNGYEFRRPEPHVSGDVQSSEGIIDVLKSLEDDNRLPNLFLYLSEFSKMMGNVMRAGTSTISPVLTELYDCPPFQGTSGRTKHVRVALPYVNIMAATQPDILTGLFRSEDMVSGFANRWLYVLGDGTGPKAWPPPVDRAWMNAVHYRMVESIDSFKRDDGTPFVMMPSAEVLDWWEPWYNEKYPQLGLSPEEAAMCIRHAPMMWKIGMMYAALDGSTVMEMKHITPARIAIEWMWDSIRPLMANWGRTIDGQIEVRLVAVLTKKGALKRYMIHQQCSSRRWSTADVNRVIAAMLTAGLLEQGQDEVIGLRHV